MGDSLCLGGKVSIRKDLSKYPRMKFLMVLGLTLCLDFALCDPLRLQVEVLAKPEMEMEGNRCIVKECGCCEFSYFCCPGFVCGPGPNPTFNWRCRPEKRHDNCPEECFGNLTNSTKILENMDM